MHRFRKKSDAKRPSQPPVQPAEPSPVKSAAVPRQRRVQPLELLPPESDFRTSLILPDLSRRFSLLRQPDGRPVDLQDVRQHFAARRAQDSENSISEEEEEYVINYLKSAGHMPGGVVDDRGADDRVSNATSGTGPQAATGQKSSASRQPTSYSASVGNGSGSSPPSVKSRTSNASYSSKRHSNNLFGSGRYKDQTYMLHAQALAKQSSPTGKSAKSSARKHVADEVGFANSPAESNDRYDSRRSGQSSARYTTEEEDEGQRPDVGVSMGRAVSDLQDEASDPETDPHRDQSFVPASGSFLVEDLPAVKPLTPKSPVRSMASDAITPSTTPPSSPFGTARTRNQRSPLSPSQAHRVSLALEEVIRNFEQDANAEEEILTPRSFSGYSRSAHSRAKSPPLSIAPSSSPAPRQSSDQAERQELNGYSREAGSSSSNGAVSPGVSQAPTSPSSFTTRFSQRSSITSSQIRGGRVPGYVPGMHRPITPKDAESEDVSTTPRATSPSSPKLSKIPQPSTEASWQSIAAVASAFEGPTKRGSGISANTAVTFGYRGTMGFSSPYTPAARLSSQETPTPTQRFPKSAFSSSTNSPISPIYPPNPVNNPRFPLADMAFDRRDTKVSTSSSSILPPSTSASSSVSSLVSPYQSDSAFTPPSSDNATLVHSTTYDSLLTAVDSSPRTSTRKPPPAPLSSIKPSSVSAILASSSPLSATMGSNSRPDTPVGQMYTGSLGQQFSALPSAQSSLSRGISSPPQSSVDVARTDDAQRVQSRTAASSAPQSKAGASWADPRRAMSPALPESPYIQGITADDQAMRLASSVLVNGTSGHRRTGSNISQIELPLGSWDGGFKKAGSPRSPTPNGNPSAPAHRSPTPVSQHKTSLSNASSHRRSESTSTDFLQNEEDLTVSINSSTSFHRVASPSRKHPMTKNGAPKPILVNSPTASSFARHQMSPKPQSVSSSTPSKALILQPLFNSSRSSLVSDGSSYHSSDDDNRSLFDFERNKPRKQDDSSLDPEDEPTESDHEDLLNCWGGLSKKDLSMIHEKLVDAALKKRPSESPSPPIIQPFGGRSPIQNGKQRGSAVSNQSYVRESQALESISPPPAELIPKDKTSKATALLRSMVDSLPSQSSFMPNPATPSSPDTPVYPSAHQSKELLTTDATPSPTKDDQAQPQRSPVPSFNDPDTRKRALTEALFGDASGPFSDGSPVTEEQHPYSTKDLTLEELSVPLPSSPPVSSAADEQLIANITRLNAAATEALKSPISRSDSVLKRHGKKINAKLISSPHLVSSTTSVDTVPLPAGASSVSLATSGAPTVDRQTNKLSLRIKKLRDKLKTRPGVPNGEEITPYLFDPKSPSPSSSAAPSVLSPPTETSHQLTPSPAATATDIHAFRFPSPALSPSPMSPPPTAGSGTGFKGFMSRLRSNSKREASHHSGETRSPPNSAPPSQHGYSIPHSPHYNQSIPPDSPRKTLATVHEPEAENHVIDLQSPREEANEMHFDLSTRPATPEVTQDDAHVRQLFDAASNLGLDKAALNELLARSASNSSRSTGFTPVTRSNSVNTPATSSAGWRDSSKTSSGEGLKRTASSRVTNMLSRVPEQASGSSPSPNGGQVIVRRTIIFPSEAESSIFRKPSVASKAGKKKNRMSAQSNASSRSVQDRVPTPPPARGSKRFSKDGSPPVPSLPPSISFNASGSAPSSPVGHSHKSQNSVGSAYGSLFDMYGDESSFPPENSVSPSPGNSGPESGQALEVVELSNGEVIWSVVDAMRNDLGLDDEVSSMSQSRMSGTSDYSAHDQDKLQVFFREHRRMGSKGSGGSGSGSTMSRRKVLPANKDRPETKVFFSSATHIGRLVEAMSKGAEAGSFNFVPPTAESPVPNKHLSGHFTNTSGHSPAMSLTDNSIPMEDRLEHLLKFTARHT